MIKSNELRIGNWIKVCSENWEGWKETTATSIYSDVTIDTELNEKVYFEPIPLTEEWLLKFGFINFRENYWTKGYFMITAEGEGFRYLYGLPEVSLSKHVHQLQNLYFALTGEELKPHTKRN